MEFPRETATIKFGEDTPWFGIEVELYSDASISFVLWVRDISDRLQQADDKGRNLEEMQDLMVRFGDETLQEWNIEKRGEGVPATGDGLASLSVPFGSALMVAWSQAVSEAPAPLVEPSVNGATSEAPPARKARRSRSRGTSSKRG